MKGFETIIYYWRKHNILFLKWRYTEEMANIKHYIMLHPEKFPEPEKVKFGDKISWYHWASARRT